jgi:hypothetical protein
MSMNPLRRHGAFAVVLAALAALYLWLNAFDDLGGLGGDGLIYAVTARAYAPFGPPDALAAEVAGGTQFPPVYSLLLMAGGGAASLLAAHLATAFFLLCAFASFYLWLCSLGVGRLQAALGVALLGAMPGTWVQSFYLHPEGLYVALTLAALNLLTLAERTARAGLFWAASVAVGLAIVTRTVGVALLPALAVTLFRSRPRWWIGMIAAALAPEALWSALHHPPWGYADTLIAQYGGDTSLRNVLGAIAGSVVASVKGLGWNVVQTPRLVWPAAAVGIASMAVALWRFVHCKPDAWYLMAYLGVMALWPFPEEAWRLTWVVVPILLGHFLWAGEQVLRRAGVSSGRIRSALSSAPGLIAGLTLLPGFALLTARAAHPLTDLHPAYRHVPEWYDPLLPKAQWLAESRLATVDGLREFAARVPEGQCVFSTRPLMTSFFTGRTAHFTPREGEGDAAFDEELRRKGCRFFVVFHDAGRAYTRAYYPLDRLGTRLEVIAKSGIDIGPADERRVAELAILKPDVSGAPAP